MTRVSANIRSSLQLTRQKRDWQPSCGLFVEMNDLPLLMLVRPVRVPLQAPLTRGGERTQELSLCRRILALCRCPQSRGRYSTISAAISTRSSGGRGSGGGRGWVSSKQPLSPSLPWQGWLSGGNREVGRRRQQQRLRFLLLL